MILVGNPRGGARNLALHLLKEENDHVQVHEIRGFASETLPEAFNEAYAISRATRCKQFLFSLSINPPPGAHIRTEAFEDAVNRVEAEFGLSGQPRAIVFHEKEGRRHAHAVWSRIDPEAMKAIPLPFSKVRLRGLSRELFIEHGLQMPRGLADSQARDPRNFSLEEYQQAKRQGRDKRAIKTALQDAWAISDSKAAFLHALEERGFKLACGDRRGFVAVDYTGEPYAVAKWAGVRTGDVRARLGSEKLLPKLAEVRTEIASGMVSAIQRMQREQDQQRRKETEVFARKQRELVDRQRAEREMLARRQDTRQQTEAALRQARYAPGVRGVWNRLTGEHKRVKELNQREAYGALLRDRGERDEMIWAHLTQRAQLRDQRTQERVRALETRKELRDDRREFAKAADPSRDERREEFNRKRGARDRTHGPSLER